MEALAPPFLSEFQIASLEAGLFSRLKHCDLKKGLQHQGSAQRNKSLCWRVGSSFVAADSLRFEETNQIVRHCLQKPMTSSLNSTVPQKGPGGPLKEQCETASSERALKSNGDMPKAACAFWLPKKKRFCTNQLKPGQRFCGNHLPETVAKKRVPCPVDPSHTVAEDEVAAHVKKCPAAKQAEGVRAQPYFHEGINAGSDDEAEEGASQSVLTSREKRALVEQLSEEEFLQVVRKIETAYATACPEPLPKRVTLPERFASWVEGGRDSMSPFSLKHWEQQASILGNMQRAGLIDALLSRQTATESERESPANNGAAFSAESARHQERSIHTAATSPQTQSVNSATRPAERQHSLAAISPRTENGKTSQEATRLAENEYSSAEGHLEPTAAELDGAEDSVARANGGDAATSSGHVFIEFGAGRGYLANALYECFGEADVMFVERRAYQLKADRALRKAGRMERIRIDIEDLDLARVQGLRGRAFVGAGKHLCGPATDMTLRCCLEDGSRSESAIANGTANGAHCDSVENGCRTEVETRSEMKAEKNEKMQEDDSRTADSNSAQQETLSAEVELPLEKAPLCSGVAIATCCHHLCSWRAYVNKAFFQRLGLSPAEFHMLTWFTSWCVSGPKFGENRGSSNDVGEFDGAVSRSDKLRESDGDVSESDNVKKSEGDVSNGKGSKELKDENERNGSCLRTPVWDVLPPSERLAFGRKCKRLIDTGRLEWLAERKRCSAEMVEYVDEDVSPENRLLLARMR